MIRREEGAQFFLITQNDHAIMAGELAKLVGNEHFAPLKPEAIRAIALHDCGWPMHDDQPTLNPTGAPRDVFETPVAISTEVWRHSVEKAIEVDPYAGMIISQHVLRLSSMNHNMQMTPREYFLYNKFQHKEIERQQELRGRCGLSTEIPVHLGLGMPGSAPGEDLLRFNCGMLKAMDTLSLALCYSQRHFKTIEGVEVAPGKETLTLRIVQSAGRELIVDPWPFNIPRVDMKIAFKRLPARNLSSEEEFHQVYRQTTPEVLEVSLKRRR